MQITRRKFLHTTAVGAASALAYGATVKAKTECSIGQCVLLRENILFNHGVSSGDVTYDSAILWTRYLGVFNLSILVWETESRFEFEPVLSADASPKEGGYVHVDISGLKPYTHYEFAFIEIDNLGSRISRSRIGRFTTAPHPRQAPELTIGAVSCTHNDYDPVILQHAAARDDIDTFLFLGDTSYNDGCSSLKSFRDQWSSNLTKKGYLELRASTSIIATLDDHEVTDNFDPETVSDFIKRNAYRTFFENTPIRINYEEPARIWRSFKWGKTLEIFVLDCRTERRPSTRSGYNHQYVSRAQMEWLKEKLLSTDSAFKLIMNSVPIGNFPFIYKSDRWEGYPQQREEILNHIDDNDIPGVLWVSGDFHFASVGRVSLSGPGKNQTEILAGPGAQMPNYLGAALNLSRQFDWASLRNNYVTMTFDPASYQMRLVYHAGLEDPRLTRLQHIEQIHSQTISFQELDETGSATLRT